MKLTDSEADEMIRAADVDGDGQVSIFDTFYEQLLRWFPWTKILQRQSVIREKLHKTLS